VVVSALGCWRRFFLLVLFRSFGLLAEMHLRQCINFCIEFNYNGLTPRKSSLKWMVRSPKHIYWINANFVRICTRNSFYLQVNERQTLQIQ
jgi:hypothetical protein